MGNKVHTSSSFGEVVVSKLDKERENVYAKLAKLDLSSYVEFYGEVWEKYPVERWEDFKAHLDSKISEGNNVDRHVFALRIEVSLFLAIIRHNTKTDTTPPLPEFLEDEDIKAAFFCELEEVPLFIGREPGNSIAEWRLKVGR